MLEDAPPTEVTVTNRVLRQCPVCGGELVVARLDCRHCGTAVEGRFAVGPFAALTDEQIDFVTVFIRCEGKFTRMEGELGLSYPTLRSRLHDVIRALGFEPGAETPSPPTPAERRRILERLEAGELDPGAAVRALRGEEAASDSGFPDGGDDAPPEPETTAAGQTGDASAEDHDTDAADSEAKEESGG